MSRSRFGIIASVMEQTEEDLERVLVELYDPKKVQTLEFRLDQLDTLELPSVLQNLYKLLKMPAILAFRSGEQWGTQTVSLKHQWHFWKNLPKPLRDLIVDPKSKVLVDFDLDLLHWAEDNFESLPFPPEKIGVSSHDFHGEKGTDEFVALLRTMEATKTEAFIKIIGMAKREGDDLKVSSIFLSQKKEVPLISFLMGKFGEDSRRKCLSRGSAGVYGYFEGRQKAAPGQLSTKELWEDKEIQANL